VRRFLRKLNRSLAIWYYWTLDYVYAAFWQVLGFMKHGDSHIFLKPGEDTRQTSIILIPGVYERWEFMKPVAKMLFEAGYVVHVIEGIGYNRGTIEDMAKKVHEYCEEHNIKNSVIVAHSKGGLIGKYILVHHNKDHRFRGVVALNTPFSGSWYAYIFPFKFIRVFAPNSPLLRLLAMNNTVNNRIISIFGIFDPHIPEGSFLDGAKNIRLRTYGHFRIIKDKRVHAEILKGVESLSAIHR
jgi:pimeloyl-ACP methyl ester carboxylesterase